MTSSGGAPLIEARTVVVTGASRGIGKAITTHLAARGYRVFAGVRDPRDGEALTRDASEGITPIPLDVTERASIATAQQIVRDATGGTGLTALVNNAGIVMAGPLETLSIETLRRQFDVNLIGAAATTQAFLPLIREARGRIVNVSSISGRMATRFIGAYAASKFALEGMSDALRLELRHWGIRVVLIEPGAVYTDLWETSRTHAVEEWERGTGETKQLYARVIHKLESRREPPSRAMDPTHVARLVVRVIGARNPRARYLVGWDARIGALLGWILPTRIMDRLLVR